MHLARAPMRALHSPWRKPPEHAGQIANYLEQMKRGRETMAAFEAYAREIGCTVGEGAMCDSIECDDEQARKLATWWTANA